MFIIIPSFDAVESYAVEKGKKEDKAIPVTGREGP
jgi:hypothetical protein